MKRTEVLIAMLLSLPAWAPAASKEVIEMQRDIAQMQDQVRELQRTFDERFAALQVLVQQTLEASNKSNQALQENGRNEAGMVDRVVGPVAGLSSKVDQMGTDVSAMHEAVNDLTARMNKVQQQLTDLNNVVKATQTPMAAPPTPVGGAAGAATDGSGPAASAGVPPVKATTLYENALRDMQSGKADLALGEFQDYVRFYNDTDLAPNAQFYIGQIRYSQSQFDEAIKEFDKVLEAYPNNTKTADSHYMKGKVLYQLGQKTAAAKEFQAVLAEFPNSSVAPNARAQLKSLGLNPPGAAPARRRRT